MQALNAKRGEVTLSNVEDLCTLLNLSMLHSCIRTLGNSQEKDSVRKPYLGPGYEGLRDTLGLEVVLDPPKESVVPIAQGKIAQIGDTWTRFAARAKKTWDLEPQLKSCLEAAVDDRPDSWSDFLEGGNAFLQGDVDRPTAQVNFFLRSFIYWALADSEKIPLVLDAVRASGIKERTEARSEDEAARLEAAITGTYYEEAANILPEYERIPELPLAVVVLMRADGNRGNILEAAAAVRKEMEGPRTALETFVSRIEQRFDSGSIVPKVHVPPTKDKAKADFDRALEGVRSGSKLPLVWYSIQPAWQLLSSAAEAVKILAEAHSPITLLTALFKVRNVGHNYRAFIDDEATTSGDFIEIHRIIGRRLMKRAQIDLDQMFGGIADDRQIGKEHW